MRLTALYSFTVTEELSKKTKKNAHEWGKFTLSHILLSGNCFLSKESVINRQLLSLFGGALAKSILIIDDDGSLRSLLKDVFEYANYEVYLACNGKEGVESYRRINTDILLTDMYMPEKNGLETIREIKKEFPEAKIIAMSGGYKGGEDFLHIARTLGAIDSIRKPFKPDDIIRIVNLTLDRDASEDAA